MNRSWLFVNVGDMTMIRCAVFAVAFGGSAAFGQVMTFEGVVAPNSNLAVSPAAPYTEAGFTLTPTGNSSAVFGPTAIVDMPGNSNSAFFAWMEGNRITLTRSGGGTFALQSLLLGPSSLSGMSSIFLTGFRSGGGSLTAEYWNLSTATLAAPGWTNLTRVEIEVSNDAGMDNITVTPTCYANCDQSTAAPVLNVNDFTCFLNLYAAGNPAANCDGSTSVPVLNVNDFTCFINRYAAGCP